MARVYGAGICRNLRRHPLGPERALPAAAARHVVACFELQRRNLDLWGGRSVFFTYEAMCGEAQRVAERIRALVPELDDLNLRRRLAVKGRYDEMLTDMNARQIARLDAARIASFNRVFRAHRDLLASFGYGLMEEDERIGETGHGVDVSPHFPDAAPATSSVAPVHGTSCSSLFQG